MENINGYKLLEEKKNSTCGQLAKAQKGRKTYLLKFFHNPVEPNPAVMDEKTFTLNHNKFEDHKRRRTQLNRKLRENTADGGNIVVPMEEFVFKGRWVEVTPFLSHTVAPEQVIPTFQGLDRDGKFMALKSIAASYATLHSCGVVHADGKVPNLLLRNEGGNYVFALIDFDGSFSTDDVPDENITATLDYFSPEMGVFTITDVDKRDKTMITPKHDVFCMGLIFHQLFTGKMPIPDELPPHLQKRREKGKPIYLYTAMLASTPEHAYKAKIDPSIEANLAALIGKMLDADPDNRPTSEQVLQALTRMTSTAEMELPEAADFVWNRDKMLSDGYTEAEKTERYGREGYVLSGFARSRFMVVPRLLELGYASEKPVESFRETITVVGDDQPWPEHKILYLPENIRRRGCEVTRGTRKGMRGYQVISADGTVRFMPSETLQLLGMARRA